eukprot:scaffold11571_cov122-Cylindrotheca_fusiformis.AAC.9
MSGWRSHKDSKGFAIFPGVRDSRLMGLDAVVLFCLFCIVSFSPPTVFVKLILNSFIHPACSLDLQALAMTTPIGITRQLHCSRSIR